MSSSTSTCIIITTFLLSLIVFSNASSVPSCNCVAFRLDDIQDYWIVPAQKAVIDVFRNANKTPLSVGIIANIFGQDTTIVNYIKTQMQVSNWDFEVVNHGYNHEFFDEFTLAQQKTFLRNAKTKMKAALSPYLSDVKVFIPPYNAINANTFTAMTAEGYDTISSQVELDGPPYTYSGGSSTLWRWPMGASTNVPDVAYDQGVSAQTTFSQIQSQLNSYGFATVMMHPQEYCMLDNNKSPTEAVNQTMINELINLLQMVKNAGMSIVTLGKIRTKFPGSTSTTTTTTTSSSSTTKAAATTKAATTGVRSATTGARSSTTGVRTITTGVTVTPPPPSSATTFVAFKLDPVQDWWQTEATSAIMNLFKTKQVPLTVGIIPNKYGTDSSITSVINSGLTCSPWRLEVALAGYNFEDFTASSLTQQQTLLDNAKSKAQAVLGFTPQTFIPPMMQFNANTLTALQNKGFKWFTANTDVDTVNKAGPLYRFPAGAATGNDDTWPPTPLTATQTWTAAQSQISSQNFAVISITPDEFLSGSTLNTNQLNQLSTLLDTAKASTHQLVLISELSSKFGGAASTAPCGVAKRDVEGVERRLAQDEEEVVELKGTEEVKTLSSRTTIIAVSIASTLTVVSLVAVIIITIRRRQSNSTSNSI